MDRKCEKAVSAAWTALARTQRMAVARIEARLKAAGLPPLAWYDVLWELEKADEAGLRPFALEKALLFEQYNLSRLVDRLEKAGLVERCHCPDDRRGQVLHISEEGRATRRRMWAVYGPAIEEIVGASLTSEEAETLAGLLGRVLEDGGCGMCG